MFENTQTLGTKAYKGQKQLVVNALLSSPKPKTLKEIVALANRDGAYDRLINDWAREKAGGVPGSVRYHLRKLKKFGMVIEIPDTSSNPLTLAESSASVSAGERLSGIDVSTINDGEIREMAREWFGYGRWDAPYWFIGPEPGMDSSENNLKGRCKSWIDLGRGDLVDCKKHHFGFGEMKWYREVPPAPTQATWRQLIRLLLAYRSRREPNLNDIRSYQQKQWGMKNGETCVIELCSLAGKKLKSKKGVNFDPHVFVRERIKTIREKLLQHKPAFVVMYRKKDKSFWEEIAGRAFPPDICKVSNGPTQAVFANHPVDKVGVDPAYWLQLAKRLRHGLDGR